MFAAKPHPLLVPHDGSFDARTARTEPLKDKDKDDWKARLADEAKTLADRQYRLYADARYSLLLIFQALDATGKDSLIRHVFAGVNPSGLQVTSFKQPTPLELKHDFLWRTTVALPPRGTMGIFNRSYYEEVLVVRVHPDFLAAQRLPDPPAESLWQDRMRAIRDHERFLAEQGTVILKFWLNMSKAEQKKQLLERIEDPDKNWKFNARDLDERALWDRYIDAYQEALNGTSRPWAPWYVIPADDKHYARWQVAKLINAAVAELGVDFPRVSNDTQAELKKAKARLLAEKD